MAKRDRDVKSDTEPDEEVERCPWCRPGSAALKSSDERRRYKDAAERSKHKQITARDGEKSAGEAPEGDREEDDDYEPELSWISCTRCKTWYHSDCVTLQELVEQVDESPTNSKWFQTPGSSGSLPSEVIRELQQQGFDWDWTGAMDRWYCSPCIAKAYEINAKIKPRSTIHRNYIFPSMTSADDMILDGLANNQQQGIADIAPPRPPPPQEASRPRRKTTLQRPDYHALNNNISTPTYKWLSLIKDPGRTGRKIREAHFPRVDGSVLRKSWLDGTYEPERPIEISPEVFYGPDREPIIVPSSRGGFESMGGKVPAKEQFSIDDVVRLVGTDTLIDVIDVATQSSAKWTLSQWAYYFKTGIPPTTNHKNVTGSGSKRATGTETNTAAMNKVYNVISLECTGTDLAKLVRPPRVVREIDWVDNCWPDIKKKRKQSHASAGVHEPKSATSHAEQKDDPMNGISSYLPPLVTQANGVLSGDTAENDTVAAKRKLDADAWPKVKLYCLMGKAGSWTDWHVDFAASCVYYTIISGCKVFYFIKPTPENLAAYARWSSDEEIQQKEWLGDLVEGPVEKVTLKPGDTMIIPTGYIHAVYTPEDTIVLGGNFLHSYNIETQLRLRQIEIETKVPQKMRFPYFDRLCWYVADHWVKILQERKMYRPKGATGQEETPRDPIPDRVLQGLIALSNFLVGETAALENPSTDLKRRKLIHDRIPKEVVVNASGLARELQWRSKQLLTEETGGEEVLAESGGVAQSVPEEKGQGMSKKRKRNPQAASKRLNLHEQRPRLKNPVTSEWDKLDESINDTERIILRPRPTLTDGSTPTSTSRDFIAKEETQTITQRRKRVRENSEGDIVEDYVQVTTMTTTRTWTTNQDVKSDWERRLREDEGSGQSG